MSLTKHSRRRDLISPRIMHFNNLSRKTSIFHFNRRKEGYEITPHVTRELNFYSKNDLCSSRIPILFAHRLFEDTQFDWKNKSSASGKAHLARNENIVDMQDKRIIIFCIAWGYPSGYPIVREKIIWTHHCTDWVKRSDCTIHHLFTFSDVVCYFKLFIIY